jgi:hypothetical protein
LEYRLAVQRRGADVQILACAAAEQLDRLGALKDRKFATAPNSRSPRALRTESASLTSACNQVTLSGSARCLTLRPRFSTCTDMPASTDRRTQDALIVPVPPM